MVGEFEKPEKNTQNLLVRYLDETLRFETFLLSLVYLFQFHFFYWHYEEFNFFQVTFYPNISDICLITILILILISKCERLKCSLFFVWTNCWWLQVSVWFYLNFVWWFSLEIVHKILNTLIGSAFKVIVFNSLLP